MFKVSTINKALVGVMVGVSMLALSVLPVLADDTVYVTKTGSSYHFDGCSELEGGAIKTNLETAKSMGYEPCPKCVGSEGSENISKSDNNSEDKVEEKSKSKSDTEEVVEEKDTEKDKDKEDSEEKSKNSDSKSDSSKSDSSKDDAKSDSSKSNTSKNSTSKSSKSSKSSNSSSTTNSRGEKILMTEKQRRAKFKSVTNPKIGTAPTTPQPPHAVSGNFVYGDIATFNNYASKNGLGGKAIYLLGTIMDIQKVTEGSDYYGLAIMVNDCDGYQWYLRFNCDKSKFDMMKNELNGKAAYLYGTFAGYSGVTNRPMMDVTTASEVGGQNLDLVALYHR